MSTVPSEIKVGVFIVAKLARLLVAAASPFLRVWECFYFRRYGADHPSASPVFIIGAPRTGSTVLYQSLTNYFDVLYFDNCVERWRRNIFWGFRLSFKRYGALAHDNFTANHGSTASYGDHSPSECGAFWYRWLPRDRHFVDHNQVGDKCVAQIRSEITAVSNYYQKPFIFKNLNAGQRLRLLIRVFPDARFIFIRRDPRFVLRSILKVRAKLSIGKGNWWSVMPANVDSLLHLDEAEMCAAQVYFLEKQIMDDLKLFPAANVVTVHYRELGPAFVSGLGERFDFRVRTGGALPDFVGDDLEALSMEERVELERAVNKYPFDREVFQ